jgi:hypothetical protein
VHHDADGERLNARIKRTEWIEEGKQIGKSFSLARDGKTFYASVAIQKQGAVYRVRVDEIDEDLIDAEIFAREDSRTFESLNEAIAFIELTTAVKIEDLKPSKGQKWFF